MSRNAASTSIIRAFLERRPARLRNDRTNGLILYYHDSPIATHLGDGKIALSCCGYNTPTTRLRLNTICALTGNGQPFHTRNFTLHFNSSPTNADDAITIQILRAPTP